MNICVFAFISAFVGIFFHATKWVFHTPQFFFQFTCRSSAYSYYSMRKKYHEIYMKKYSQTNACANAINCVGFYSCSCSLVIQTFSPSRSPIVVCCINCSGVHSFSGSIKWYVESVRRVACIEHEFISCYDWSFKQTKNDWFLIRNSLRQRLLTHFLLLRFALSFSLSRSLSLCSLSLSSSLISITTMIYWMLWSKDLLHSSWDEKSIYCNCHKR